METIPTLNPCDASRLSRRDFIRAAAAVTAAATFGAPFISRSWAAAAIDSPFRNLVPATRKVRVAIVGCGGRGVHNVNGAIEAGGELVALCDVDFARGSRIFFEHPQLPRYRDYRQMLDEMHDRIDAVCISTPDHMHYPIALMAIERGKHVYVEKPLNHTIGEARILKAATLKHGVVTQMGNQGHANDGTRITKEWIEAGVIGHVREVHSWSNRPIWPQNVPWPDPKAEDATPKPDTLDWNLWLGVAPYSEYLPKIVPFNWRGFWDYGCGALGDMGCHLMDAPFWALNLTGDCKVSVDADGGNAVSAPKSSTITYRFPARGSLPPLKYVWHDGRNRPPIPKEFGADEKLPGGGTFYFGDKGVMYSAGDYGSSIRLLPESRMKTFTDRPPKTIPRPPRGNPYLEWIAAIKGGPAPGSNIVDHSAGLTEFVSLGNLALRAGKTIEWDSARGVCSNAPEAQVFINKSYRVY